MVSIFFRLPVLFIFILPVIIASTEQIATFAGGCFWCVEHDFDQLPGVLSTTSGYTGGIITNPTYKEVSSGSTGHVEAVEVTFNPEIITYKELVTFFFHNIDPTRDDGQFCDKGPQYRPVIFYHDQMQKDYALKYRQQLIDSKKFKQIKVEIIPATIFYPAEEYHQDYYNKNPLLYRLYRYNCGRDKRLKNLWGT